jgi:hypothetical protein
LNFLNNEGKNHIELTAVTMVKTILQDRVYFLGFVILMVCIVASIFFPRNFPTFENISQLLLNLSIDTIVAVGMMLLLISGVFDLSVGSIVAFISGLVAHLMFFMDIPVPIAIGLGLISLSGRMDQRVSDCLSGHQSPDPNFGHDGHLAGRCLTGGGIRDSEPSLLVQRQRTITFVGNPDAGMVYDPDCHPFYFFGK